uniref:FAD dependent oxidoreductase domain-containing protein n=1 Tax=Opuntia streptacantha TaxID=393608 RepID=A0A7C9A090_OPUST
MMTIGAPVSSIVVTPEPHQWKWRTTTPSYSSPALRCSSSYSPSSFPRRNSLRCAVLGAGFAGLSVAWHLLRHSPKELKLDVDIFDEVGIGGGASGVAGGLIHPYSPKVKPLWRGEECWSECLHLLSIAEAAASVKSIDDGRGVY